MGGIDIDCWGIGARWDIRSGSRGDTVLDIGSSQRIRVEGLDVENIWYNVHV